jgi:hypothetical protein
MLKTFARKILPRRRWFRYSLRTMLIVTTLLGVWFARAAENARKQERAVKAIEAGGGTVGYHWCDGPWTGTPQPPGPEWLRKLVGPHFFDTVTSVRLAVLLGDPDKRFADIAPSLADLPSLRTLSLFRVKMEADEFAMLAKYSRAAYLNCDGMELSDESAAELAKATSLERIGMYDAVISDRGVSEFTHLPRLEMFSLQCRHIESPVSGSIETERKYGITDASAAAFLEFPRLRSLSLAYTQFTDSGVATLSKLQRLDYLSIYSPELANGSVEQVVKMQNLTELCIGNRMIDDQGLARLKELPNLKRLSIGGAITNDGLPILAELKQLERLALGSQAIDGDGLRHLVGMKNLKVLDLQGTSATYGSPAVKQLQQALPGCTINTYTPSTSFFF